MFLYVQNVRQCVSVSVCVYVCVRGEDNGARQGRRRRPLALGDYAFRRYALACTRPFPVCRTPPSPSSAPPLSSSPAGRVDFFTFLPLSLSHEGPRALSYVLAVLAARTSSSSSLPPSICMHLHLYTPLPASRRRFSSPSRSFLLAGRERSVARTTDGRRQAGTPRRA